MSEPIDWAPPFGNITGPGSHAILMVGVDNIGSLEKLFGQHLVKEVLAAVHRRLSKSLPRSAVLWRPQSRIFAVTVPGMDRTECEELGAQMQAAIARNQIETETGPVAVTISVGCAAAENAQLGQLGSAAHDALIEAMSAGVGSIRVACEAGDIAEHRAEVVNLAQTTMEALGAGQLVVAYQPVVSSRKSRAIAFHECFARIKLEDGSMLSAAEFMPAAETMGLATLVDRQVLVLALEALGRHPNARLSVNLCPQTLQDAAWMSLLRNAVREAPSLGDRLILELSEANAVHDADRTKRFMAGLSDLGVAFALDDFGSGHTSFGHLREFRFDMIKIDKSFIEDFSTNPDNRFFVKTLVTVADRFEMLTVAEAVQTEDVARDLADMGVEYFQGFAFGQPNPVMAPLPEPLARIAS
ncbi:MAG: GGDEF domain-containing phosphodiesterase [Pseudomonadota bacterium]